MTFFLQVANVFTIFLYFPDYSDNWIHTIDIVNPHKKWIHTFYFPLWLLSCLFFFRYCHYLRGCHDVISWSDFTTTAPLFSLHSLENFLRRNVFLSIHANRGVAPFSLEFNSYTTFFFTLESHFGGWWPSEKYIFSVTSPFSPLKCLTILPYVPGDFIKWLHDCRPRTSIIQTSYLSEPLQSSKLLLYLHLFLLFSRYFFDGCLVVGGRERNLSFPLSHVWQCCLTFQVTLLKDSMDADPELQSSKLLMAIGFSFSALFLIFIWGPPGCRLVALREPSPRCDPPPTSPSQV